MKVLVVSNYTLIGRSLVASLQGLPLGEPTEIQLCQTKRVAEDASTWSPHVVLIEATVDFAEAISTLSALSNALPHARIVLLGRESDEATVYEAILRGASGYLRADATVETLANTLKGVAQGELGLSRQDARQVVHHLRQAARARSSPPVPEVEDSLTPREREVFDLVRRGMRSREIAQQLTIADATVYKHIQNILEKLRVHSRTQAIFMSRVHEGGGGQDPPTPPRQALS